MKTFNELGANIPLTTLCSSLGVSRASAYRQWGHGESLIRPKTSWIHPRSLNKSETQVVLEELHSERFMDRSPAEVYATLLEEGRYLCSLRTMYRILEKRGEAHERRAIVRHGQFKKPELIATMPNQVWSWDITKLLGPVKWTYFYLYVLLDIFSRYVVGWMIADREAGALAKALIEESCIKQDIREDQLTIHSDRGGPMISQSVAFLLADLGVTKSLSRPQVSNDNPFSEAQFKTLKYSPHFPERFGCKEDAVMFARSFFPWYNDDHKHSGIGYYTPADVHYGRAAKIQEIRAQTLATAYAAHPERFVLKPPTVQKIPTEVWINPPQRGAQAQAAGLQMDTQKMCPQPGGPFMGTQDVNGRPVHIEESFMHQNAKPVA